MPDDLVYAVGAISAAVVGYLAFKYPDRAISQEDRPGIPRVKGRPLVGTLFEQISNIDRFYNAQIDEFEGLDTMTTINSAACLPLTVTTIDPRNIEYFLKTNFSNYVKGRDLEYAIHRLFGSGIFVANGEKWKLQRKTASRIFNMLNFRDHFSGVFIDVLKIVMEQVLDPSIGQVIDFQDVMFKLTLDTFVQIGFGTRLGVSTHKGTVDFAESFDVCQRHCKDLLLNPFQPLMDTLAPLLPLRSKSIHQHYSTVNEFAYSMIEKRRREVAQGKCFHEDLLSHFMNAHDDDGNPLSDEDLRDAILNLVIAGRDTTAVTLTWTLYCLMMHPRVENKLLEEISHRLSNKDITPAEYYEAIKNMTYAHAVLYEVLRLYPAVPSNLKAAVNDDVWPDGTHIKKGDTIAWSSYAMGRSDKVWSNAKEFKPERWIADDGQIIRESRGKWPVFHVGPRVCLGQHFATLQALITLTTLLRHYKFSLVPNQTFDYFVSVTMPVKGGLKVFVEKRE